jgi:cysteine synthase
MQLLGAKLQIVKSDAGRMTEKLTCDMIEAARGIAKEPGAFWSDQLNNGDPLAGLSRDSG